MTVTLWRPHRWHDCAVDGHVGAAETCQACVGGLGGCTICNQWEGAIRHAERCPGVRADSFESLNRLIEYHYAVAPVFRKAKADDLYVGRFVVFLDAGAWQYPCRVEACRNACWDLACLYGEEGMTVTLADLGSIGVYDPHNAEPL